MSREIAFGQKIWAWNSKAVRWVVRYYVGTMEDRTRKYVTTASRMEVDEYKHRNLCSVLFYEKISLTPPKVARAYKNASEALDALGKKVSYNGYERYVGLYKTGINLQIDGETIFMPYSKAFKELVYVDGTAFGVEE